MGALDIFTGDSAELRLRERQQRDFEDEVFKLHPDEEKDLAVHVRADVPRFAALNIRTRLDSERQARKSDRNAILMAAGMAIIAFKVWGVTGVVSAVGTFVGRLLTGGG